jgi:type II secretory pathway component PulL
MTKKGLRLSSEREITVRIGFIDWTEKKLSLYIFEKKDNQYTLANTLSVPIEGELNQSSLTPLIKTNVEQVYLSVPLNLLSIRELNFPFSDKNKIKDSISYELEGILLGNTSDYSIDYLVKELSESGSSVLATCIEKSKLREIIELFSSVGLEPIAITSIDIKFYSKNIETLFESHNLSMSRVFDGEEIRAEAAKEELVNLSINLRQAELSYKGDIERIKKSLRLTGVLVFLLLLIFGLNTTMKFISMKKEHASIIEEINAIYHNAFPGDAKIVDAVRQFKGNLNFLREKKTILGGIPALDILLNIATYKNKDITLTEFNTDEENIIIKGTALSFENVDAFKNTLSSSFAEVRVMDSRASPDRKISFSIIMKDYKP